MANLGGFIGTIREFPQVLIPFDGFLLILKAEVAEEMCFVVTCIDVNPHATFAK